MKLKALYAALCGAFLRMHALTPGFENPQQPSAVSETFTPDQLIAGRYPLITAQGAILTGAAALQRGSVLGQVMLASAAVAIGIVATGTITFSAQPAAGDTVTVNGTVVTFKAAGTILTGNQVAIGADLTHTVDALLDFLSASADTNINKMTYTAGGDVITCTSIAGGTAGNAYTLAKSSVGIAISGANLTGGTANTGNGVLAMDGSTPILANAGAGVYAVKCTVAGANSATFRVTSPKGDVLGDMAFNGSGAVASFADRLKFTITDGSADFVVGDLFNINVLTATGKWKLSVPGALDGSQIPSGILADYADASAVDVGCAVYLAGEFNANALTTDPGWEPSALVAAMRPYNIYVRTALGAAGTLINQ